jgi:hypothetical protein
LKTSFLVSFVFLIGCAGKQISIESDPVGADVFVFTPGQAPKKVGQTPYALTEKDISDRSSPIQIQASKDGYQSTSVIIPSSVSGYLGKISFKLEAPTLPNQCLNQTEALNKVARAVAEAQSLMKSKQYDLAEKIMSDMIVSYPGLSLVYDILGNIYYLRREFDKSLNAYKKSRSLSPENAKTQRMIQQIEDIKSGRDSSFKRENDQ